MPRGHRLAYPHYYPNLVYLEDKAHVGQKFVSGEPAKLVGSKVAARVTSNSL